MNFKALLLRAGSAGVFLASLALPALAVNTPTELRFTVTPSDVRPPLILIGFNNNEGDSVRFATEITVNGVSMGPSGVRDSLRCVPDSANGDDCKGNVPVNLRDPRTTQKGWRAALFAPPAGVQFDTDYCFRVQAIDDNARQSAWAPWACTRTQALPRRPAVTLTAPHLTLLAVGSDGRGQVGGPTPGRMLVEWTAGASFEGSYVIERALRQPGTAIWGEVGRVPSNTRSADLEFVDNISNLALVPSQASPSQYRVCAANLGGKTCSGPAFYPLRELSQQVSDKPNYVGSTRPPSVVSQHPGSAALLVTPSIVLPAPGSHVDGAHLLVQISAPPGTETRDAEVEFTLIPPRRRSADSAPRSVATVKKLWKTTFRSLIAGAVVPAAEGPSESGMWLVRVHSVRGASADPWSEGVSFTYAETYIDARSKATPPVWVGAGAASAPRAQATALPGPKGGAVGKSGQLSAAVPLAGLAEAGNGDAMTQSSRNAALMRQGKTLTPAGPSNSMPPSLSAPSSFGNGTALNPQPLSPAAATTPAQAPSAFR